MATKSDTTYSTDSERPSPDRSDSERVFINVAIPTDLHRRLRIRQITDGLVMRDVITAALEAWL